jgi:sugar (pentulose or hexulose) kinase
MKRVGVAIGIDIGTSGVRAALVDEARETVAFTGAPLAEPDRRSPDAWWSAVVRTVRQLGELSPLDSVAAMAVDGTSGTVLPIDAAGTPLGPASLYNDPADAEAVRRVEAVAPPATAARGPTSPLAKLLVLQHIPGIVRMLHQADWIAGRLCGRFDLSDANNALKTGFDPRRGRWPEWLSRLDLRDNLLPAVVPPGTPACVVAPAIASLLGLASGVAVVAGTTDSCAGFLATGATEPGDAVTSLGTTLVLKLVSTAPVFDHRYGIYSHLMRGRWLAGGASNTGGAALARYFDPAAIAQLSERIDPTQDSGFDYYPLPRAGERFPIADARMAPREMPRPADDARFLHGLLEGVARVEAEGYRRLTELGAPALRSVRSVGGGASNRTWTALRQRMLGVEMLPARAEEAAVGTAGLALSGLGVRV